MKDENSVFLYTHKDLPISMLVGAKSQEEADEIFQQALEDKERWDKGEEEEDML